MLAKFRITDPDGNIIKVVEVDIAEEDIGIDRMELLNTYRNTILVLGGVPLGTDEVGFWRVGFMYWLAPQGANKC